MSRLSVSLGAGALPDVAAAIEHARQNPTHDPVLFVQVAEVPVLGREPLLERRLWWACHGEWLADHSLDPTDFCAKGGTP